MAQFIPSFNHIDQRIGRGAGSAGERRVARALRKLDDDWLVWYDQPVGERKQHSDFILLHPRIGLLLLEVKAWRLDSLLQADPDQIVLATARGSKKVPHPIHQVRAQMLGLVRRLQRNPLLLQESGEHQGNLCMPYGHAVAFSHVRRAAFAQHPLAGAFPMEQLLFEEDLTSRISGDVLEARLRDLFVQWFPCELNEAQLKQVRGVVFPELVIQPAQADLFQSNEESRELLKVMDLQQEKLARGMGEGHRVVHGVAGSGKTMILLYRARQLLQQFQHKTRGEEALGRLLILCFNKSLAGYIRSLLGQWGLLQQVEVFHFHRWRKSLCKSLHVHDPGIKPDQQQATDALLRKVELGATSLQYDAILVDEGHDFQPSWLELVVGFVKNHGHLLLLYDDTQSIYRERNSLGFSLSSVGIRARGRTHILKLNYRNTRQILSTALHLLEAFSPLQERQGEIPQLRPEPFRREGPWPELDLLPDGKGETQAVCNTVYQAIQEGTKPGDIAVLTRTKPDGSAVVEQLKKRKIAFQHLRTNDARLNYRIRPDQVNVMTMHSSKGLEFPLVLVTQMGLEQVRNKRGKVSSTVEDEARLRYVAMTRATERLCLFASPDPYTGRWGPFVEPLRRFLLQAHKQ